METYGSGETKLVYKTNPTPNEEQDTWQGKLHYYIASTLKKAGKADNKTW